MDLTVPEYAYMSGFLQADGHLSQQSRNRGGLTVEVSARDIDLLRQFQKLTPYNSSITERTRLVDADGSVPGCRPVLLRLPVPGAQARRR
ncbi:LAGLIDADG family homing endonuclease [Streptomyces flaveolus]|uniref:LAGLIDADG family homing endonuclease n=1 Tax=Streptomyces flaveolus TaxID=67297 RepID=UPI0033BE2FAA